MGIIPESRAKVKPGDRFGRWTVLGLPVSLVMSGFRRTFLVVECECGGVGFINQSQLTTGKSNSCGCLSIDAHTTHGAAKRGRHHKIYAAWKHMRDRCRNPRHEHYSNYGGRGIVVCEEWIASFEGFRDWSLANGYADHLTIDRIDNEKGYFPDNCRWTTIKAQARNRRTNRPESAFGETKLVCEWAEDSRCVVSLVTLKHRFRMGWEAERAITEPNK